MEKTEAKSSLRTGRNPLIKVGAFWQISCPSSHLDQAFWAASLLSFMAAWLIAGGGFWFGWTESWLWFLSVVVMETLLFAAIKRVSARRTSLPFMQVTGVALQYLVGGLIWAFPLYYVSYQDASVTLQVVVIVATVSMTLLIGAMRPFLSGLIHILGVLPPVMVVAYVLVKLYADYSSFLFPLAGTLTPFWVVLAVVVVRSWISRQEAIKLDQDSDIIKAKTEFLVKLSHEMRTPLNSVIGFSEFMLDSKTRPESLREYAKNIHEASQHLLYLINDLMDLSKLDADRVKIDSLLFDPEHEIRKVFSMCLTSIHAGVDMRLWVDNKTDFPVFIGDPGRLRQIALNLLANAVKFTHKGSISVTAKIKPYSKSHATLTLAVKDTGIGIPEDKLKLLFDEYMQADEQTRRVYGGTGLGLAISERLARLMDGRISVDSTVGEGSTFTLTLPLQGSRDEMAAARLGAAVTQDEGQIKPLSILIAEDNHHNRLLMKAIFDRTPHTITFAENGLEAVCAVDEKAFDVILMDIDMPVMDGRTAASKIYVNRQDNHLPDIPIIAVTAGEDDPGLIEQFDDVVKKPLRPRDILNVLRTWSGDEVDMDETHALDASRNGMDFDEIALLDQGMVDSTVELIGKDTLPDLLDGLFEEVEGRLVLLKGHIETGDYNAVGSVAHEIKGVMGNYGAKRMSTIADVLYKSDNDMTVQAKLLKSLDTCFSDTRTAFQNILDALPDTPAPLDDDDDGPAVKFVEP